MSAFQANQPGAPASLDAATIAEAFQLTAKRCASQPALRTRDGAQRLSWAEYAERVRSLAAGLSTLGVGRGATIALMLTNRPEFHLLDTAALHLGATPFSVYNTYPAEQIADLLARSGSRVIATEQSMLGPVTAAAEQAGLDAVVVVDGESPEGTLPLAELEGRDPVGFDFEAAWRSVEPSDVLTVIYTSGTTGPPKGVELTHANMLATLRGYAKVVDFPAQGRVISWLPMAHIAERACSHYLPIVRGYEATCVTDPREVVETLPEVRPTWFFAVPRIWEKVKAGIEAKLEQEPSGVKRTLGQWALETGIRKARAEQQALAGGQGASGLLSAQFALADRLVLSKMRARLGLDRASSVNVGAAPTPAEVIEFFHGLGVPLAELWGMSESCASGCVNPPRRIKIGTVGPPLPGFEVRLAEDGELLLRGPGVMVGYRGEADKTREVLDDDGWLATGDVGEIDDDGYVRIVDRKKELIINAAGKNMSPANIEGTLKAASPLIGQAVVIGDSRPYNVALLTLDPDAARAFAAEQGIEDGSLEAIASAEAVQRAVAAGVEEANGRLARVEQIKRFELLPAEWEAGGDELTPTMKLKRKPIAEKYSSEIDALYEG